MFRSRGTALGHIQKIGVTGLGGLERIKTYIIKTGDHIFGLALPCWSWTGTIDDRNRPRIKIDGNVLIVRRALYQLNGVPLEEGDKIISLCRNKACLRPEHLVIGTDRDAFLMGRMQCMGPGDIYVMQEMFKKGEIKLHHIEDCYDVTRPVAEAVVAEGGLIKRSLPMYSGQFS